MIKKISKVIKTFTYAFDKSPHTDGEWMKQGLVKYKTFLSICFGLGDLCFKCGLCHIDVFDPKECKISSSKAKHDGTDTQTAVQLTFVCK